MLLRLMKETISKIENDKCEMSEDEASKLIELFSHQSLSKVQACEYMNLSRSRFDDLIREGKIPKGRKRKGFKELVWYKDELSQVLK